MRIFSEELHYAVSDRYWALMHWLTTPRKQLRQERDERIARNERIGKILRETFQGRSI